MSKKKMEDSRATTFFGFFLVILIAPSMGSTIAKSNSILMDNWIKEGYCKNFTIGNPHRSEFYSPGFPANYPPNINCSRSICAEYGYFVRIDFRDIFSIEPSGNDQSCDSDYLEVRDGDKEYSPLLGKFCGFKFPPIIISSGRSLWLKFVSDGTIEYNGFRVVFSFIPNPSETLSSIVSPHPGSNSRLMERTSEGYFESFWKNLRGHIVGTWRSLRGYLDISGGDSLPD